MVHHLESVHVIIRAQKLVQNEQLSDTIGQVQELDEHVDRDQVVAVAFPPHEAAVFGDLLTQTDEAAGAILSGALDPAVHVADYVLDGSISFVGSHVSRLGG